MIWTSFYEHLPFPLRPSGKRFFWFSLSCRAALTTILVVLARLGSPGSTEQLSIPHFLARDKPPPQGMCKSILLPCLLSFLFLSPRSLADVGTAASYGPPYLPTACYGSDESQFPPNNLFAAAGDAIWDNGASCGRRYLVRCLSSATPGACMDSSTVEVTVVDYAPSLVSAPSAVGATMVLSETAFGMISQSSANEINIEFTQV